MNSKTKNHFKKPIKISGQKSFKSVSRSNQGSILDTAENQTKDSAKSLQVRLKHEFIDCSDFILREVAIDSQLNIQASVFIAFIDGFVDKVILNQDVIQPILSRLSGKNLQGISLLGTLKKQSSKTVCSKRSTILNKLWQRFYPGTRLSLSMGKATR